MWCLTASLKCPVRLPWSSKNEYNFPFSLSAAQRLPVEFELPLFITAKLNAFNPGNLSNCSSSMLKAIAWIFWSQSTRNQYFVFEIINVHGKCKWNNKFLGFLCNVIKPLLKSRKWSRINANLPGWSLPTRTTHVTTVYFLFSLFYNCSFEFVLYFSNTNQ